MQRIVLHNSYWYFSPKESLHSKFVGKSNYCFPAIKVTFTTGKNSYLFELIMTEILKKWGKIMMIKIFSTLITCTAELVKGPEG